MCVKCTHIVYISDKKEKSVIICLLVSAEEFQFYFERNTHIPAERPERWRGFAASAELSGVRV